ncbi:MAG TPA: glycosyltransferase [Solirubrobacterales bacterium]|nr:glycosyltransferase [Solirubrobacterales bacterium]
MSELSVIVATHNRGKLLGRCLEALCGQSLERERFEVIVADDGSEDDTAAIAERYAARLQLRLLGLDKGGQAAAQNAAIEAATAPLCLFLDDDCIPDPGCLAAHLEAHRGEARLIGIGALTQAAPEARDWYAHAFAAAWNGHYERLAEKVPSWTDCYGGNLSVRRDALAEVGGFSIDIGVEEDADLAFRLYRASCAPTFVAGGHAIHDDQKLRARLLGDSLRQGAGHIELARRYPDARPKLLGWFSEPTPRDVTLRRALLALRLPPTLLASLGRLLPSAPKRMLWFYFVSRYAFWLGVRRSVGRDYWVRATRRVPVLMYHSFDRGDPGDRYVMPRRSFARQMRLLRLLRCRVLSFERLVALMRSGELPPRRAVAITIDDGYRDNLEVAAPVLRRHRFGATIFLVSNRLGGVNDWDEEGAVVGRPLLDREEIAELGEAGISFGAHTRTHRPLPELADAEVSEEIAGSRQQLEGELGIPVTTFAYPYGRRDERAVAAVAAAGYEAACTTHPLPARLDDDLLQVPRIEVRAGDSLRRFAVKLCRGGR